ncbi:uncharacterized protein LOC144535668 [Sander vitreus]
MSAEKDVSISNTYPVTFSLINIHLLRSEGDGPRLTEFKTKVRSSLIRRMNVESGDEFVPFAPMISSMLDPRHKRLRFLTPTPRLAATAKLVELGEAVETGRAAIPQAQGDEAALSDTDGGSANTGVAASQSAAMAQRLGEHYTTQCEAGIEAELQNFLRETPPTPGLHPHRLLERERNKVPRAGQVSAEVPVHPGNVSPLRAGVFGGWTGGHQVAVASDPRSCQHAYLSQQKSVDWCRSCM